MQQPSCELARQRLLLGEIEEAARLVAAELQRREGQENTAEVWSLRFMRAQVLFIRGDVEGAAAYLASLPSPNVADVKSLATLKARYGGYLGSLGRCACSHRMLAEAESMARRAGLFELLGEIHLDQAFSFFLQKDYLSSDRMFRAALGLGEHAGGWYLRGHAIWGIGKNLMIQTQYREAIPWLEDSLGIFQGAGAKLEIALLWSELAVCSLGLGRDEEAMQLLRTAEKVTREAGFIHNYQVVLANIGNVYLHRRDYSTAIAYYRHALTLARQIRYPVSVKKWTYNINLAYARIRASVDEGAPRIA
jgi:tetratricopeptide (TPR) repeat protein